jgi:3-deoxy-D-manno-octulosonate 8-phosphate phosphatase (KDO 8-P phosphatase)
MENSQISTDILMRAKKVKLLLMDCDGVLTDGRLYFSERGEELKVFHVRDGQGLANWHKAGFQSGIITGRDAEKILHLRATELGIHYIKTCSLDKVRDFEDILQLAEVSSEEAAFIGDDIGDTCLLRKVGFPVVVADAAFEAIPDAILKTKANGGYGAVRELIDLILHAKSY